MRAQSADRPPPGVPSAVVAVAAVGQAHVEALHDRVVDRPCGSARGGSPRAAARPAASAHWPSASMAACAERGVDGEDLAVADVADGPGLGDRRAVDGDGDVDVHDRRRRGVGEVLRGRPDQRPPGRAPPAPRWPRRARSRRTGTVAGGDARATTGRYQRCGLCVGSRPRNCRASIGGDLRRRAALPPVVSCRCRRHRGTATPARSSTRSGRGERSPAEELEATLAAIDASDLNAFAFLDADGARDAAAAADVSQAVRRRALGVKELEHGRGLAATEASLVFTDRIGRPRPRRCSTRLVDDGGAVAVGQTTASEFGGLNVTINKLHGVTPQPVAARHAPPAGRPAGQPAAVAGGLVPIAPAATAAGRSASRPGSTAWSA